MVNIKEMLLTLPFEKASFSDSKKKIVYSHWDTLKTARPGETHTMKMATGILRLSENKQYLVWNFSVLFLLFKSAVDTKGWKNTS